MTNDERIAELERQSEALAALAAGADLGRAVPTCPGWSVAEVVRHVGGAHRWCLRVVEGGEAPSSRPVGEPAVEEADLVPWFHEGLAALLGLLRTTPPTTPTWTPVPAGIAAWWVRKMVVETAIHRWDVEAALAGASKQPPAIPAPVAIDGIEEYVGDFVVGLVARAQGERPRGRIDLVAVEGGTWPVDLGGTGTTRIGGFASDLLLWFWNRLPDPLDHLDVTGDASVVEQWHHLQI